MPLPAPTVDRKHLHTRTIVTRSFERSDGLWDIEGSVVDTKTYDYAGYEGGQVSAGTPVHGMSLRMTIDRDLNIHDMEAVTDYAPYRVCGAITPNFKKLVGLNLGKGFRKAARELVGGTQGCVHLVDLLGPMATTAFQTFGSLDHKRLSDASMRGEKIDAFFVNGCHTLAADSPVIHKEFPTLYTAK